MSRRLLASLLLCAALLMQAFGAQAYARGEIAAEHCRKARAEIGAALPGSDRTPADHSHAQHHCSLCQIGFGHAMAGAPPADVTPVFAPWRRSVRILVTDSAPAQFVRHVVGARAPPVSL